MKYNIKKLKFRLFLPIILSIVLAIGIFIGNSLNRFSNKFQSVLPIFSKLDVVLNTISREYVDSIDKNLIIEQAIHTIVSQLDPHSKYLSAETIEQVTKELEGKFYGIGIQFNILKDTVLVIRTIKGGPSDKVGILAGDKIVTVNDSVFASKGVKSADIIRYLKGEKGSSVRVGVKRRGEPEILNFEIIRDDIAINSIDAYYMINKELGYIKINKFSATTHRDLQDALRKLKEKGMKQLILDLRDNGGGYLQAAVNIADEFLPDKRLIVYTKGRKNNKKEYYATGEGLFETGRLVVLINSWSASASEVVTGAIQDNDRGTIIGRRSYGKGLVQVSTMFRDGSALELTVARYYSPSGRCIQKPYNKGNDKYNEEVLERYVNGEFLSADSISFDKTKKFTTVGGKIVYGGGGITPDIFVPIDTALYSPFIKKIVNKMNEYVLEYVDNNRPVLSKFTNISELTQHLDKKDVTSKFFNTINDIKSSEIKTNYKIINTYLQALIGRNILGDNAYFQIMEKSDKMLQVAINYIEN